jgi:HEAT repeat protein
MREMRTIHLPILSALAMALCLSVLSAGEDAPKTGLAALVATIPDADPGGRTPGALTAPTPEVMQKVYAEILKEGKDGVVALINMLVEPGKGQDYKARCVLHSMMTYVMRPDPAAEKDRATVQEALLSAIGGDRPKAIQAAVLQELKWCGGRDSKDQVEKIAKLLADDELCEYAAQALVAMKDTAEAFRKAMPAAQGKNRVTVVQALGALRDEKAVEALRKDVASADAALSLAACEALANIGDADSADALLQAADKAKEFDRTRHSNAALLLAERLIAKDDKKTAERIYAKLFETRTMKEERHVRIAALMGLGTVRSELKDLVEAMKSDDLQVRAAAQRAAVAMPGPEGTTKVLAAMENAPPADRAGLLRILAARADAAAIPVVLKSLKDSEEIVRIAASEAAAVFGGADLVQAVIAMVNSKSDAERAAAVKSLETMKGNEVNGAVGTAAKGGDAIPRAALLGVLATRRAEDQADVALAALSEKESALRIAGLKALKVIAGDAHIPPMANILKDPKEKAEGEAAEDALTGTATRRGDKCAETLVPMLGDATPESAAAMLRVLGATNSRKGLDAIVAQTKNANAPVKDAAVRALSAWKERDAVEPLLEVARTSDNTTHQVLALRQVVVLVEKGKGPAEKIKWIQAVVDAAKRPDEKRLALAALVDKVQTTDAIKLAATCIAAEGVREEACEAVLKLGEKIVKTNPDAAREALEKVVAATTNGNRKRDANKLLSQIAK